MEKLLGPRLHRLFNLDKHFIKSDDERILELSFSSEEPYLRVGFFEDPWVEILGHKEDEIDLSAMKASAPLLYMHNARDIQTHIGVIESVWTDSKKASAEVRFTKHGELANLAWERVKEGILKNVSVGYDIFERSLLNKKENEPSDYRVTKWLPREASLVTTPADFSVGIGRDADPTIRFTIIPVTKDKEVKVMTETEIVAPPIDTKSIIEQERKRALEIRKAVSVAQLDTSFADSLVSEGISIEEAREKIINVWAEKGPPKIASGFHIDMGENSIQKFVNGMTSALLSRSGLKTDDTSNNFRGFSLMAFAQRSLELRGVDTTSLDRLQMVSRAFTNATSDFPNVLADIAHKSALKGYEEQEESFEVWTVDGVLTDYKQAKRVDTGLFPALAEVPEGAEYKSATMADRGEPIQLATYGRIFSITRQAIINDDINVFTRVPMKMGRAARRTIGNLVYAVLTSNQTLSDGVALFHASHNNLASTAGVNTSSVDALRVLMAKQTDNSAALNIRPRYMIVPVALEGIAKTVATSQFQVGAATTNNTIPNSVMGTFEVVSDARLDADDPAAWYMAADPNAFDTLEVAYLDGRKEPFLDQQEGWNIDGTSFKVRIDAGVAPLDFRGLAKTPSS